MRGCGTFAELRGPVQRLEPDRRARERVDPALLAVDDADRVADLEAGGPEGLDRRQRGAAGGDDVLDEARDLPRPVLALDPVRGAVALRLLPDDHERQPARE